MGKVHPCPVCGGYVSSEFGCSHFGFYREGAHCRHAICCAALTRLGSAIKRLGLVFVSARPLR